MAVRIPRAAIAGVVLVAIAGAGFVTYRFGWQTLLHPAALIPHSPIQNAQTVKLEKQIADGEADLKKQEAAFAPVEARRQAIIAQDKQLQQDILRNQNDWAHLPSPTLKRLWKEQATLRNEWVAMRWHYNLEKFKVMAKRKDVAELHVQLLAAQQGPGDVAIADLKQMLATRQGALKAYEDYVNVLGDLQSAVFVKWFQLHDSVREGRHYAGRSAANYEKAKHDLAVIEGPHKQFDTALENAKKKLEQKRQEVAALKEALMSPEERRNRDAMRAMVMRGIAQGMANLPDPDYQSILPHNGTTCRTSSGTASIAPARIGSPCQINDGGFVSQGTVSSW